MKVYIVWFLASAVGLVAIHAVVRAGGFSLGSEFAAVSLLGLGSVVALTRYWASEGKVD